MVTDEWTRSIDEARRYPQVETLNDQNSFLSGDERRTASAHVLPDAPIKTGCVCGITKVRPV